MDENPDNQADGGSFSEQNYFDTLNGSVQDEDGDYSCGDIEQRSPLREQDRFLPIANVAKIMKRAVPANGKVAKDAKECVQECVSEFISFITSEAAEKCQTEKRKTINGEDILCAMNSLGFDNYVEPLKSFLVKFREISKLESQFMDDPVSSNVGMTGTSTMGSTVLLTPTLTTVAGGRQFTLINGSTDIQAGASILQASSGGDLRLHSTATMATLGTPISSSLGPTIILPLSTQLAIVNGTNTNTISTTDMHTSEAS